MKGTKEWETIKNSAVIKSDFCFLILAFIKLHWLGATIKRLQQMPFGKLFPLDNWLIEANDLVGSYVGGSIARIRINWFRKTPQAGCSANRWFLFMCSFNLKHSPDSVKSFLSNGDGLFLSLVGNNQETDKSIIVIGLVSRGLRDFSPAGHDEFL